MQKGGWVGDVGLPPWAKGDPHVFIRMNRKVIVMRNGVPACTAQLIASCERLDELVFWTFALFVCSGARVEDRVRASARMDRPRLWLQAGSRKFAFNAVPHGLALFLCCIAAARFLLHRATQSMPLRSAQLADTAWEACD